MKVILFGATGMIGEGALIECLEDPQVEKVLAIVRRPTKHSGHAKLEELIHSDYLDYSAIQDQLVGYDTCLFCLGISSAGMSEADYRRITYDFSVAAGEALVQANPQMSLCFVSGNGTDANSRTMWARVKGEAENALMAMPWKASYMFRPAGIVPEKGVVSGVASYRFVYRWFGWTLPLFKALMPDMITTSPVLGRALIRAARDGYGTQILEGGDINRLGA